MLKKLWSEASGKLISALFAAAAGGIVAAVTGFWLRLWSWFTSAWGWLFQASQLANWLIVLLGVLALGGLFLIGALIWSMISEARGPDWHSYTQDDFFGVTWRWRYQGNRISGLELLLRPLRLRGVPDYLLDLRCGRSGSLQVRQLWSQRADS